MLLCFEQKAVDAFYHAYLEDATILIIKVRSWVVQSEHCLDACLACTRTTMWASHVEVYLAATALGLSVEYGEVDFSCSIGNQTYLEASASTRPS